MKRKRPTRRVERAEKRLKHDIDNNSRPAWPLLRCYYPKVLTLRQYLVSKLSGTKKTQKKLLHYGHETQQQSTEAPDRDVVELLDSIVVGTSDSVNTNIDSESLDKEIALFTQQLSESPGTITPTQGAFKQSELVDFAIWLIFRRHHAWHRPSHLLSHGYQKSAASHKQGADLVIVPGVPGIWSNGTNPHVEALKAHPWATLPRLLGKGADEIISDMLLYCGLFQPVPNSNNLSQLSGVPMCDIKPLKAEEAKSYTLGHEEVPNEAPNKRLMTAQQISGKQRGLSDIRFQRSRMLYAKPAVNGKGNARFGLSTAHALNRQDEIANEKQTVHVMKYLFPRQFGLHNVFTSETDRRDTSLSFKDYTVREQEIFRSEYRWRERKSNAADVVTNQEPPLPKRLRGRPFELVRRLRNRHWKCPYKLLLEYYCPMRSQVNGGGPIDRASSTAQVSAFCRAVISKVLPSGSWGTGDTGLCNRKTIEHMVDKFVRLGRYETLSLHDIMQKIQIKGIPWLAPASLDISSPLSRTDLVKRQELMAELVYYLFDSFLIPLIRAHFYVTETNLSRNRLFYFRHDVWKAISDPALCSLKAAMLEPCNTMKMKRTLAKRELGVSQIRLLPKEQGMRPIINLRRRVQRVQHGRAVLGKSINTLLTPAFSVLNYEKSKDPTLLASSLFSVDDMFPRLQAFRATLEKAGLLGTQLYFAKVDVKACFDTIPQKRLLQLVRSIVGEDAYDTAKYARGKLVGGHNDQGPQFGSRPFWKWLDKATAGTKTFDFADEVETDTAEGQTRSVYVDSVLQKTESRKAILDLLEEHLESNMITLGNRMYRQKRGIPQGSMVSTILCSYFYAELERQVLPFVAQGQHSVLLRLIDDFLLITTERPVAERFMRTMHAGVPEFGVEVKAEKSRANFDVEVNGVEIAKLPQGERSFPYCGSAIDTVTLDLSKDLGRRTESSISDAVAVEHSRAPGQNFYRKTLNALKQHMKPMLVSTSYNSVDTVLANLQHCFTEVAQKTYHYMRALAPAKQPHGALVIRAVDDLIELACILMKKGKRRGGKEGILPYTCSVRKAQTRWLACTAFAAVFRPRQTKHRLLLAWLAGQLRLEEVRREGVALLRAVEKRGIVPQ